MCLIGYERNDECVQRSELIDSNPLLYHGSESSHTLQTFSDPRSEHADDKRFIRCRRRRSDVHAAAAASAVQSDGPAAGDGEMRRTIQQRHESHPSRRQMQPHALHQRVSRLLLLHGGERRAHRLLLAEPGGGALHHQHPQALLLQLQPGARGVHRPAGRHAHAPHPRPRLPHAGHGGAGGLVQQAERHSGLAFDEEHGQTDRRVPPDLTEEQSVC